MIEIRDLMVAYRSEKKSYTALREVNLTLPEGSVCAVIGPSGCGKSTLLKVLAGILTDYAGTVQIGGSSISPLRQRIGFIPQNYGLLPWRSVYENIRLGLRIKEGRPARRSALDPLLRQLGIEGLGDRYPGELSGGQRQRVSLARAFALRPDLLLMDEPFSALDAITREEIQDVFLDVWQKNAVTTVLVTHHVEEAVYLGQRIVVLSAQPGAVCREFDNPLFGGAAVREQAAFFSLVRELKGWIREARS